MTKDEALKMCLEYIETDAHERKYVRHAIKEALAQQEPNYKKALEVWLDKTEWIQETVKPHELGMHRADVLKQRIQEALAQPEQEPVAFASHGIVNWIADKQFQHEALLYSAPQRTWVGLTEEEIESLQRLAIDPVDANGWGFLNRESYAHLIEAKLRSKNENR